MSIQDGRARVGLPGVGELRLSRADRTISLHVPTPVPAATVEHPLLVPAAATVAYWQGRASVHAAAVLVDGRVWGLLGDRGAGKSTLAAELLLAGGTLFADDLLILTPDSAFAGPPFIDLRGDVAARFPATLLGEVGRRERWRLLAPTDRLEAQLGGWIVLESGPGPTLIEPLGVQRLLPALADQIGLPIGGEDLLAFAARPAIRFRRSQHRDDDAQRILAAIASA